MLESLGPGLGLTINLSLDYITNYGLLMMMTLVEVVTMYLCNVVFCCVYFTHVTHSLVLFTRITEQAS